MLVIDDDIHIGNMLEEVLLKEGYFVSRAYSGTEALMVLEIKRPDLILLDLMLPGLDGEEVFPQIKGVPVIIISAKIDIDNKVELLLGGAADYIIKPFNIKELLARIAVTFRNLSISGRDPLLIFNDITLCINTHAVTVCGRDIKLTRTEYAILRLLMQNPSQVFAKSLILERISVDTPDCTENSLKIHVSNLRKKLREATNKDYIEAVWGIGFKLREE